MPDYGSMMSQHEAQYKASVMYDTWGHLDAKPGEVYKCSFFVSKGDRDYCIFNENNELPGGPAFYHDINEYVYQKIMCNDNKKDGVYYFEGTYQMYKDRPPKDTEYIGYFKGRFKNVKLLVKK